MTEVPSVLRALRERAASDPKRIVLSEGDDPRVIAAAISARDAGMAQISVVGDTARVMAVFNDHGDDAAGITIHDPATSPLTPELQGKLVELRGHKGMTEERAARDIQNRLIFAALLVRTGHADGTVGGAVETTSATVRAALQIIGKHKDAALVSSFFLMAFPSDHWSNADAMIFSDCGLVIDPSATELSAIAEQAAASCAALMERDPQIAMLSFSTKGSASHPNVTKVTDALADLRARRPDLSADGELQFDAAIVPSVGAKKAPGSSVAGQANVLVFPNLDAGNIGYKIAQRLGGAEAIGPVLQGLALPANDLSRGCVAEDIVNIIAVTAAQSRALGA
ncbi:phosphate acetyltransferase [Shimia ponticola]|uniref:phosphate acetyltransferase n=1 Tax=Shimia ponticola TaxID=2582893 RepID=UPI0011BF908B|nr:phosphate acetyltransferase [Shimia ponticola]